MLAYDTLACLFCLLVLFALRVYKYIFVFSFCLGCLFVFLAFWGPFRQCSQSLFVVADICVAIIPHYTPFFLFFLPAFFPLVFWYVYLGASFVVVVSFCLFPFFVGILESAAPEMVHFNVSGQILYISSIQHMIWMDGSDRT